MAGGVLSVLDAAGAEMVPLFHSLMGALGPAADDAVTTFADELVQDLRNAGPLDGLVLYLHGACWDPGFPNVDRYMIECARAACLDLPIAVPLDYHGNVNAATFAVADIAEAYRHSPISTWPRPANAPPARCCGWARPGRRHPRRAKRDRRGGPADRLGRQLLFQRG